MKSNIKIEEVKSDFMCPKCNVTLKFEQRVLSKDQIEEQKRYYKKMTKTWLFRFLKIGPSFRVQKNAIEMRCPQCQKLYHVEKEEVK